MTRLSIDYFTSCHSDPCLRRQRHLGFISLAILFFSSCASAPPGQLQNGPAGSAIYSLTTLHDGEAGSREQAAKRMDIDAKNMCASGSYTRISEESIPIINRLGEATFSRLIWQIECVHPPEQAVNGSK
jgi:hypothetical protein